MSAGDLEKRREAECDSWLVRETLEEWDGGAEHRRKMKPMNVERRGITFQLGSGHEAELHTTDVLQRG